MFNVCLSLRDPIPRNLKEGNLRSEGRWERFALEAFTTNPEVEGIYTLGYEWTGGKSVSPKYKGILPNRRVEKCVLVLQDWNNAIYKIGEYQFLAAVINIFKGPWLDQKEQIAEKQRVLKGNLFFTMGHPDTYLREFTGGEDHREWLTDIKSPKVMSAHLVNFVDSDHFFFLPLPWIPKSCFQDKFNNKVLLYGNRLNFLNDLLEQKTFLWALQKLSEDSSLSLRVITGWNQQAARNYDVKTGTVTYLHEIGQEMNNFFWTYPEAQNYIGVRNRVFIHYSLDYPQVLAEYSNAKLLIEHATHHGGPSMEAAMHGVPFVGMPGGGSLAYCPDYLTTVDSNIACNLLDNLMSDHKFYQKIAGSYHDYVMKTYSFDAFNSTLNTYLKGKGLI